MTRSSVNQLFVSRWTGASAAALVLAFAAACSEPAPPPAPPAPPVKSADARVQAYKDCWNHFNTKDWDALGRCYTETAVSESIDQTPPTTTGRAAIIERDRQGAGAFPDRKGEVWLILANDARIASVALYAATNDGPFPPGPDGKSMPATKKKIGFPIAHTLELDATGDAAVREAAYVEEGTLMAQLGLNPSPQRKAMTPTGAAATVVIAKNDDREAQNIAMVNAMLEANNKYDLKAMEGFLADDYKLIEIGRPADLDKKGALKASKEFFSAFPDFQVAPAKIWAAGDYVVIPGTVTGTNTGDMPSIGLKKTGKKFTGRFLEIVKIENGKIKEDWLFYNGAAFAAQLGLK